MFINYLAILGITQFAHVFLRAFQQQNVMCGNFRLVPITSYGMALTEVLSYGTVAISTVQSGLFSVQTMALIIVMGTGGALGCVGSMKIHRRMRGIKC